MTSDATVSATQVKAIDVGLGLVVQDLHGRLDLTKAYCDETQAMVLQAQRQ